MSRGDRARRAEEIFAQALARPPSERSAFLERACAGDAALFRELSDLLPHAEGGPDFLVNPFLPPLPPDLAELFGRDGSDGSALLPEQVGGYSIVSVLGRGATGVVYEARQDRPPRPVAVKVFAPVPANSSRLSRFVTEAQLLARLDHPGIARFYASGVEAVPGPAGTSLHRFFLVMEHVQGQSLDRWADRPDLSLAELLDTFAEVCDAVAHAHRRGVLHRDLKPGNILVTVDGHPKVLDFGIACTGEVAEPGRTRFTASGRILGSLAFMSPEQLWQPRQVDERSDVYSLGVILYRLLACRLPYDLSGLSFGKAAAARAGAPPPLSRHHCAFGGELESLVATAMAWSPFERYPSVSDLADDVRRYLAHQPIRGRGRWE